MRRIVTFMSDPHGGSRAGLLDPETALHSEDEGGNIVPLVPELTKSQQYLWWLYSNALNKTAELAGSDEINVFPTGDLCQGNKHAQMLVSTRLSDQPIIAARFLSRWFVFDNVKKMRIAVGTGAHNYEFGSAEILVQTMLTAAFPDRSIEIAYHGLVDIDGYVIDYAHHGPFPGSKIWLAGNAARAHLRDLMLNEIIEGQRPADLYIRGHYHKPVDITDEIGGRTSRLIVIPSFCMLDDHAVRATQSTPKVTNGLVNVELVDGRLVKIHKFYNTIDIRTREKL